MKLNKYALFFSLIMSLFLAVSCDPENDNVDAKIEPGGDPFKITAGFVDSIQEQISIAGPNNDLSEWMSLVDNDTKVCKMTIPGSHDATTGYGYYQLMIEYVYNLTAISQISTLDFQLRRGIRYFDIRTVVTTDTLTNSLDLRCAHGISEIRLTFAQAIDEIHNFLAKHPSEFVIVKLQHDNGLEDQIRWPQMMSEFMASAPYGENFYAEFKPDMTIKDARGKILFINRTEYHHMLGASCTWPNEDPDVNETIDLNAEKNNIIENPETQDVTALYVQDYYKTNKPNRMAQKIEGVKNMLRIAGEKTASPSECIWIINHCSAYTVVGARGYAHNAANVHSEVIKYLKQNPNNTYGIVVMDFACYDNLSCIINGGTPYSSEYLYGIKPLSQSLTNLLIKTNFPNLNK